ncbi:type VII secretion-associated serine protease mycosin [Labedaea rhizosphaerae]|uniref:Type VII secretion-associated serine protease mycosin n=1 Tax=Labedaea rhizosphaerae TaxID=598644 RepID=A0A4R6SM33_LABRH|nr:type VII secretion-associated serine protease mycosin [Labedaea rhizosphaerae]TDQ04931.1 type VII secretion-associated serine protease mycosin [Labedaea rhizosphaerae]
MKVRCAALALFCLGVQVSAPAVAHAEPPPNGCLTRTPITPLIPDRPWEDKLLDPSRVWPVTKGARIRVGVVDSGVDSDNPQLRQKVFSGYDFVLNRAGARIDCAAHGTAVASIIVAAPIARTAFHGIAPDVRIVPARVTDSDEIKGGAAIVAQGIRYTVDNGVKVLNLSLTMFDDDPVLRSAVEYAQAHDVLVVAAAGNHSGEGNPTPYPAAYPGVLGVGSIDISGAKATDSQTGPFVKLVAPGVKVTGCNPIQGLKYYNGTSFATPYVAGVAALVRAAYPKLTAAQVADRLIETASVARGGRGGPAYGAGIVDPYRAVMDTTLGDGEPGAKPTPIPAPHPDPVAGRKAAAVAAENDRARHTATVLLGGTALVLVVAGLVVAGHRRRWTVTRRTP